MSDTPRTDRCEINTTTAHIIPNFVVDSDVCRELERENAALREELAAQRQRVTVAVNAVEAYERLVKENAALKEQLKDMTDQFFAVSAENAKLRSNFMAAESEIILLREERDALRAESAELLTKFKASDGWDDYSAIKELQRENAELKIERNRYKVALQDIALANDQWPGYKAREVLEKEAQP